MPCKVWDELTYPFPNFNNWAGAVWEWISKLIPYYIIDVITNYHFVIIYHYFIINYYFDLFWFIQWM